MQITYLKRNIDFGTKINYIIFIRKILFNY